MKEQLDLIGRALPAQPQPAPDRRDPVVWISRLAVLRKLDPAPDNVIRDIRLRRGLNIVWAPPASAQASSLFEPGLAGHTAGKTTFCRFLRHVLGEPHFASEVIRRSIRERIPEGWIVGEVFVAGVQWTAGRPFAVGAHPFAVRGKSVDEVLESDADKGGYQSFLDAISDAAVAHLPARRFPGAGTLLDWPHLLAWLTRDQECHFAEFHEWRDASSGSDSPALSAEDRHYLLRAVLGLVSDEEATEQAQHSKLQANRRAALQDVNYLEREAATEQQRLCDELGIDIPAPEIDLFRSGADTELARRRASVEERIQWMASSDRRKPARQALERAIAAATNARRDVAALEERLALEQGAVDQLYGTARADSSRGILASLPPARDFCQVPVRLARERGCPLVEDGLPNFTERLAQRSLEEEISHHSRMVAVIEEMLRRSRETFQSLEHEAAAARRELDEAQADYDAAREEVLTAHAELNHFEWLTRRAKEAARRLADKNEELAALDRAIAASLERQAAFRQARESSLRHAATRFEYVVRAILGNDIEASLRVSGRDLTLHISRDGERDSAAMDTVRVLAFDLGALTASIEGIGNFPRFLVHDCPRESDLAPDVYERVFLLAQHLEEICNGQASFQYIVTTTTPPPPAFQGEPWLRLQLAGTPSDRRLLCLDL